MLKMTTLKRNALLTLSLLLFTAGLHAQVDSTRQVTTGTADTAIYVDELPDSVRMNVPAGDLVFRFNVKPYNAGTGSWYAMRLTASLDDAFMKNLRPGMKLEDTMSFGPGQGMAAPSAGILILTDHAFHYLFVNPDDPAGSRLVLVEDRGKEVLAEVTFRSYNHDGDEASLSELAGQSLYLAFVYDANLNDVIDPGEMHQLILDLY